MKKFFGEFKEFISKGNVLGLAVGVIIGGAFQKIVTSLVNDVLTPFLGLFGNKDLSELIWKIGEVEIKYGAFITAIIDFLIMAFIIFLIVKTINKVMDLGKKKEEEKEEAPTTKECPYCFSEIDIRATKCPHCTENV